MDIHEMTVADIKQRAAIATSFYCKCSGDGLNEGSCEACRIWSYVIGVNGALTVTPSVTPSSEPAEFPTDTHFEWPAPQGEGSDQTCSS